MRFFGGADLGAASTNPRELVEQGYRNGVPMGGTMEGIQGADVHGLGDKGSQRREPRPNPDLKGIVNANGSRTTR